MPTAFGQFAHVFIVAEENHSFNEVIGDANMPYLNGLVSGFGLAVNFYADTHPSIGNYFAATSGVVISNDDGLDPAGCGSSCNIPNVFDALTAHGVSWKEYAEDLPSVGYLGGNSGGYAVRHAPAAYYVQNDPALSGQANNIVPFTQLASDLAAHQLPTFAWITPNGQDNQHDGTDVQADQWLQANIEPVVTSPDFAGGVLMIWYDEGNADDCSSTVSSGCGGQVAVILAGTTVKHGYQGPQFYMHGGALRFFYDALGLGTAPGTGATSNSMSDFFN